MKEIFFVDKNVKKLFPEKFKKNVIAIEASEKNKNIEYVLKMVKILDKYKADRHTKIYAVGGGNTLDMVGFLAGIYMRGLEWIAIPTTLLAMCDVVIGGKTGVNFDGKKNHLGLFNVASRFIIDLDFLNKLPEKKFNDGMAEVIKHALISDKRYIDFLSKNSEKIKKRNKKYLKKMIDWSIKIKKTVINNDPNEKNIRKILNFGHTFGHAIEQASKFKISHGEAVAIGMILENEWCEKNYGIPKKINQITKKLLQLYSLPTELPKNISIMELRKLAMHDKKKHEKSIGLVLIKNLGKAKLINDKHFLKC